MQRLILDRLAPCLSWLEDLGAPVLIRETGNPLTTGARFAPRPTVAALSEDVAASGGRVCLGAALAGLVQDSRGRVTGVRVLSDEGRRTRRLTP